MGMVYTIFFLNFPGVEILQMWTFDIDYVTENKRSL